MKRTQRGLGVSTRRSVRARGGAGRAAALALALVAGFAGSAGAALQEAEPDGRGAPNRIPDPSQLFLQAFPNGVAVVEGELGAGDVDFFSLELEAGQLLLLAVFDDEGGALHDTRLGVFQEPPSAVAGAPLATNDDGGPGFLSRLAFPVSASGSWKIALTGFRDSGFDGSHAEALQGPVAYRLVIGVAQSPSPLGEGDVDATHPLPAGGAVLRGALDPAGVDAFPIDLAAGQVLTASLFDLAPGVLASPQGELHDTLLGLRDPSGTLLAAARNDDGGPGFLSNLAFEVPAGQGGRWTLVVSGFPDRDFEGRHIQGPFDYLLVAASVGEAPRCDVDGDGFVDRSDIEAIFAARGQPASGPLDPRDADGDGQITILDGRACTLECDFAQCAPPPSPAPGCGLLGVEALLALLPRLVRRRGRGRAGAAASVGIQTQGDAAMKRNLFALALVVVLSAAAAPAAAVSLGFAPSLVVAPAPGGSFDLDLLIDGLGSGAPPSVGGFDIDVAYDPATLALDLVVFGTRLGDPALFEALVSANFSSGLVDLGEVSLLSPAALDALQPAGFTLATLSFRVIGAGSSEITIANALVSDAGGSDPPEAPRAITIETLGSVAVVGAVPEPGAALAFALGLAVVAGALRRAAPR